MVRLRSFPCCHLRQFYPFLAVQVGRPALRSWFVSVCVRGLFVILCVFPPYGSSFLILLSFDLFSVFFCFARVFCVCCILFLRFLVAANCLTHL